ncbi:MAG: cobaltochelatase subunit CobT [Alphaproteobacteria bacterium]|nr:cobaltochelatase subunit CobT [Alphaproteobacteria bacterium]
MTKKEDPQQEFKQIISAAYRAVSGDHLAKIEFTKDNFHLMRRQGHLEGRVYAPSTSENLNEITLSRGEADAAALWLKHHNKDDHLQLRPKEDRASSLFDALEVLRVSAIGAQNYKGIAHNIHEALTHSVDIRQIEPIKNPETLIESLRLLLWEKVTGLKPEAKTYPIVKLWETELRQHYGNYFQKLSAEIKDQVKFAEIVKDFIKILPLEGDFASHSNADPEEDSEKDKGGKKSKSGQKEQDKDKTSSGYSPAQGFAQRKQESGDAGPSKILERSSIFSHHDKAQSAENPFYPFFEGHKDLQYQIFTTEFDEIIHAEDLCYPEELTRLRHLLDQQLDQLSLRITRLANRLQRRLLAKQARSWDCNLEEGFLDSQRLHRVITNPLSPRAYRKEKEAPFKDTIVTLLIDNSGSMRGKPIAIAAMCADILARTLERCEVKVEILGYTTVNWKGGRSREKWIREGKQDYPGRLNDLRHIIYKAADAPWRRARRSLGLMLREGLLKENIDGEALLWAYQRLSHRTEQRRILIVISDGAPVDDSTLSVNPGNYLDRHLTDCAKWIENRSDVELVAIGIGHDVTRSYAHALTIVDVEHLGNVLIEKIEELLKV